MEPVEPNKEDCCNSGCNPCIFDVYDTKLKIYKKYMETGKHSEDIMCTENAILQTEYTKFTLLQNLEICEQHQLLVFKRVTNDPTKIIWWKAGDHFLVKFTDEDTLVSCTRAYTPIKKANDIQEVDYDFAVIVKRYDEGLVSNYLCDLKAGDSTLWRGPYGSYILKPNTFNRMIIIAQGTGIAPFITIIDNTLKNEDDNTRVILFFCCPSVDKIILRNELYSYREYWNFTYKVFIKNHLDDLIVKYKEPIIFHKLSAEDFITFEPFSSKDQFLICGSSGFMNEYKTFLESKYQADNIFIF